MTDRRQSTKNYTQPRPVPLVPASDTLVLGTTKVTSYGPRVEPIVRCAQQPAAVSQPPKRWQ